MFSLGEKYTKDIGPEGKSFGDAYALVCAQTGEVLAALAEQDPESGFRTIDDLERYMYLQFGVHPSIIHDALLIGLDTNGSAWYTEKLCLLIDKLVSPTRKRARMERIMSKREEIITPELTDAFSDSLFLHGLEHDDWGIPRRTVRPRDEHVHFYYVSPTDMRANTRKNFYTDQVDITDCVRHGGSPSLQRRSVGTIALISGGHELGTPHRFVVEIVDQWV